MAPKKSGASAPKAKAGKADAKPKSKPGQQQQKGAVKKDINKKEKKEGGNKKATYVDADLVVDETVRHTGKCTVFRVSNGFGFIEPADKSVATKVLVHWKEIQSSDTWPSLTKDLEVEFNLKKIEKNGKFELQAAQVTAPGGALITVQDALEADMTFVGERNMRFLGDVKFFNAGKGFGFVKLQEGYDISDDVPTELFVPREQITVADSEAAPWLGPKMEVEFGIYKDKKGYGCYNVTLPGGEPIVRPPKKEKEEAKA